jgi:hypothetical protein
VTPSLPLCHHLQLLKPLGSFLSPITTIKTDPINCMRMGYALAAVARQSVVEIYGIGNNVQEFVADVARGFCLKKV